MAKIFKYEFDPFEIAGVKKKPSSSIRKQVLDEVADYVLTSVLSDIGDSRSPVTGRAFKGLDKEYAKEKKAEGLKPVPNLELEGSMLDSLTVKPTRGSKLALFVDDASQQGKVDGHNNFTGQSKLPPRKFIPGEDEALRPAIREGVAQVVKRVLRENEDDG